MDKYLKYKKRYLKLKKETLSGGNFQLLKQPYIYKVGKDFKLSTQLRYIVRVIECFLLNQVFSIYNISQNDFTKEIFKNICEVNLSILNPQDDDFWNEETNATINTVVENLSDYPTLNFRKFGNILNKEALIALYSIKHNLIHNNTIIVDIKKEIPEKSIQHILFGETIKMKYDEIKRLIELDEPISFGQMIEYSNNYFSSSNKT